MYTRFLPIVLLLLLSLAALNDAAKPTTYCEFAPSDYCQTLQYALMFYKYNRAGPINDNEVPWRKSSVLQDGDLAGGYFDAGDHIKFVLPMASSMTMLSFAYLEHERNIKSCDLEDLFQEDIRQGTDWLMAGHPSPNKLVAQVGDADDHSYWGPPETITTKRNIYWIDEEHPGTELAMEAAAALAAASMVFKEDDPDYSAKLLEHAEQLYQFGDQYRVTYVESVPAAKPFYNSWSGFKDEIVWAGLWLYKATEQESYLTKAQANYDEFGIKYMAKGNSHDWDLKAPGITVLMADITGKPEHKKDVEDCLDYWLPGGGVTYTPGGLAWLRKWGPCRYAANMAFLASVHGGDKYTNFTVSQVDYILGKNPKQQSFVVGIGPNYPVNPHHRASHHSTTNDINNPPTNTYIIKGALVGGPDELDNYKDDRSDYVENEVALDYNAGFVGALCYMVNPKDNEKVRATISVPPPILSLNISLWFTSIYIHAAVALPSPMSHRPNPTVTPIHRVVATTPPPPPPPTSPTAKKALPPVPPPSRPPLSSAPVRTPSPNPSAPPRPVKRVAVTQESSSQPHSRHTKNIYVDGSLQNNFNDYSYITHVLNDDGLQLNGAPSISFSPSNWGAIYLACPSCINSNEYKNLTFYINGGGQGGQKVQLGLVKDSNNFKTVPINQLIGQDIPSNKWTRVSVAFHDLGINVSEFDGVCFQDTNGDTQSKLYLNNIYLE
ncbi:hypothetical protein SAMD00019534_075970 [Acytostelium subglobosum LB1]|uniref:hypothetical protein n=1 Tax=Acytostelium subglobosum LB1 TaxID=1410327 RepID=UPI000644D91A|nr:hypothetical protein SAMD00019534_075970 [Acytostelium subglobosum LB1]GAM24422.1 hypothetical protein SAMD00019534_075970 [Acytostelium subglobosum LB1]|eukprot:XP_012752748.1 hypothetical protein SAMD00019534_075970 [Acytostelium subglobosum LB1]